jgi:steroid delta-isomerase-like uncharacterized protein
MSAQSNAKLAQEVYNLFSNNQFDAVLEHATDDIEAYFAPSGQVFQGHDGFKQFMMSFKTAFPNVKINVKNQVVTEDSVVTEFIAVGANTGPLMTPEGEIPATGRTAEWPVCEVWRVRNGKLASLSNYQDFGSVLRQLGLLS